VLLRLKPGDAVDAFPEFCSGLDRREGSVGLPKLPVAEDGPKYCHAFAFSSASAFLGVLPPVGAVYLFVNGVGRALEVASYADWPVYPLAGLLP
jgi:hypothetical protein